jgi:hypothetical protein
VGSHYKYVGRICTQPNQNIKIVSFKLQLIYLSNFRYDQRQQNKQIELGKSHGLVVKEDSSQSRGRGFESWHRILDGCKQFASYYIKEKLKNKEKVRIINKG